MSVPKLHIASPRWRKLERKNKTKKRKEKTKTPAAGRFQTAGKKKIMTVIGRMFDGNQSRARSGEAISLVILLNQLHGGSRPRKPGRWAFSFKHDCARANFQSDVQKKGTPEASSLSLSLSQCRCTDTRCVKWGQLNPSSTGHDEISLQHKSRARTGG